MSISVIAETMMYENFACFEPSTTTRGDTAKIVGVQSAIIVDRNRSAERDTIDRCLVTLANARQSFAKTTAANRQELIHACIANLNNVAREWVDLACEAKGIPQESPARAEEIVAGPFVALRYLRLLAGSMADIDAEGIPQLPGKIRKGFDGRLRVPVVPVCGLFDPALFIDFKAYTWMQDGVTLDNLKDHIAINYRNSSERESRIALVLGAGNVSAIPATDALSKLFESNQVVLLKMHPLNDYLTPIFEKTFAPLIDKGFLQIVNGDANAGAYAIEHELVDEVHITGSDKSHDAIVWGPPSPEQDARKVANKPLLTKPITSELGNVSPWIVVPGRYSSRQLQFQAENVAASLVNNAGFNCVATRVLLTWKRWPDRERFLDQVDNVLSKTPHRRAYYPGAEERFQRFSGLEQKTSEAGTLPWTLIRNVDPKESPQLVQEESFACVCAEICLDAATEEEFLQKVVDFANEELWGTLCVAITVPREFRKRRGNSQLWESCIAKLRYGTVAINHWPGISFALASQPWGGYPGSSLTDTQSGRGWVHNPYMLEGIEKSVLEGPLTVFPKPIWLPTHAQPESVAWKLFELYQNPSLWNLSKLSYYAVKGTLAS